MRVGADEAPTGLPRPPIEPKYRGQTNPGRSGGQREHPPAARATTAGRRPSAPAQQRAATVGDQLIDHPAHVALVVDRVSASAPKTGARARAPAGRARPGTSPP